LREGVAAVRLGRQNTGAAILLLGRKVRQRSFSNRERQFVTLLSILASEHLSVLHIQREVDAVHTLYETMKKEKDVAERLASLGTVAAGLAHEIKNPLVSIKTLAQLLPEKYDDPEFREIFARIAVDEVERINTLVSELMDFARSSMSRSEALNLESEVQEVIHRTSFQLTHGGVSLKKEFSGDLPPIMGDSMQLRQAILNIVTNGIEAMPAGGELGIRTVHGPGEVVLEITDTGRGIHPEDMERIFEPFYTTKPSGTGLGLSISRRVMEGHGGKIQVTSHPEGGTVFTLSFPSLGKPMKGKP
jgi:signal transduction histidine kinase